MAAEQADQVVDTIVAGDAANAAYLASDGAAMCSANNYRVEAGSTSSPVGFNVGGRSL